MINCLNFDSCSAPLCPLDPDLKERCWYIDEDICNSRKHGSGVRWIKKQRSVQRKQTKSYQDKPVTYDQLFAASRPKQLTDKQRAELRDRMAKARAKLQN